MVGAGNIRVGSAPHDRLVSRPVRLVEAALGGCLSRRTSGPPKLNCDQAGAVAVPAEAEPAPAFFVAAFPDGNPDSTFAENALTVRQARLKAEKHRMKGIHARCWHRHLACSGDAHVSKQLIPI